MCRTKKSRRVGKLRFLLPTAQRNGIIKPTQTRRAHDDCQCCRFCRCRVRALFYLDSRIRFERYCYGEAACLVFSVWAHGFDADGKILWDREPEFESQQKAIPRVLTDIRAEDGALQFDGAFKHYVQTEEFAEDKANGYGKWKVFWLKKKRK